jgi:hypothetical protein
MDKPTTTCKDSSFRQSGRLRTRRQLRLLYWELYNLLQATGFPLEEGFGGRTKFNRTKQSFPKEHWIDAACVGESGADVGIPADMSALIINATGHGRRQLCVPDVFGFPKSHKTNQKVHHDIVKAFVLKGKFDVHAKYPTCVHRVDGYAYL